MAKTAKRANDTVAKPGYETIPSPRKAKAPKEVDTATGNDTVLAQPDHTTVTQEQSPMSEQITIQGLEFTVPVRYSEGHTLTAGEASALNQVFHENLRNNFAVKIKKLKEVEEELDVAKLQDSLSAYADEYQFGIRTAGGPRSVADPVKREALNLAKAAIKAALSAKGKSLKDAGGTEWLNDKAEELVLARPAFMEQAKARLDEMKSLASDALGV